MTASNIEVEESTAPPDLTRRQAALTAANGLLVMAVLSPVAFFYIFPKLIVRADAEQTLVNIGAHHGLFVAGIFCYLVTFIADIAVAWALYVFFARSNRSLSLFTAWLRLAYAVIGATTLIKLVTVYRLVRAGDFEAMFGHVMLSAQVQLLLSSFRYGWSFSMLIFAGHLLMLGYLAWRASDVPKILGVLLFVNGAGYLVDSLRPLLFPGTPLPFLPVLFFGELIFMLWLFVRGGRSRA